MANSEEQTLSGQESLDIIHKMIAQAKGNFRDSSFYFLLWGWIVMAGSLGHYILLKFASLKHPELAWSVVIVGIAWSFIRGIKDRAKSSVKTYTGNIYGIVWVTFLLNYFILIFFLPEINYYITPLVLLMAASSTFVSGSLMKFRPLQYGALCIWTGGIIAFMVSLPHQLLATAVAILLGYLIPGYMLKNNENGDR